MRALPGRGARAAVNVPPAPVTRSTAHADQRRRILRAIGELVAERGYPDVTVELIVKRAHVSYKTFYKHFGSKEECFVVLVEATFTRTEATIRDRLEAESRPWPEQVAVALRTLIEEVVADPTVARAVIVEPLAMGSTVAGRYEQAIGNLISLFQAGRRFGPRGGNLAASVEDTLAGAVLWCLYQRLVVGEVEELNADLPILLELVLRTYIGPEEAGSIARAQAQARQPAFA